MEALTETMKFKSALVDKAVEGNPVMARCLKCTKGTEAAFSPYLEIQRQWQKTTKQMTITKIFQPKMPLISVKPHQYLQMTFLNTPLLNYTIFLLNTSRHTH